MIEIIRSPANRPPSAGLRALANKVGAENIGLGLALLGVIAVFGVLSPRFLSIATFDSVAFQLPELGLLTLAMLMPIISGGLNLAITFTANICGLTLAWVLHANGGTGCRVFGLPHRLRACHLRRDGERIGDGRRDRLHRRAPDPRLAFDDDLPAWSR